MDGFSDDQLTKFVEFREKFAELTDLDRSDAKSVKLSYIFGPNDEFRTYEDGQTFEVVDRYSKCPFTGGMAHLQAQTRKNFCMVCEKALTEY